MGINLSGRNYTKYHTITLFACRSNSNRHFHFQCHTKATQKNMLLNIRKNDTELALTLTYAYHMCICIPMCILYTRVLPPYVYLHNSIKCLLSFLLATFTCTLWFLICSFIRYMLPAFMTASSKQYC